MMRGRREEGKRQGPAVSGAGGRKGRHVEEQEQDASSGGEEEFERGKYVMFGEMVGRAPREGEAPKTSKLPPLHYQVQRGTDFVPASFSSSRKDKEREREKEKEKEKERKGALPEDFMDEQDLEALGYANGLKARLPFASLSAGNPPSSLSSSSIPLSLQEQLVGNASESIGTQLLQAMGWKEGQGIGPKISLKRRREAVLRRKLKQFEIKDQNQKEEGEEQQQQQQQEEEEEIEASFLLAKVAPLEVRIKDFSANAKVDRHGLGFDPLVNAPEMACNLPFPSLPSQPT
jgi:hypothetical protein